MQNGMSSSFSASIELNHCSCPAFKSASATTPLQDSGTQPGCGARGSRSEPESVKISSPTVLAFARADQYQERSHGSQGMSQRNARRF